MQQLNKAYNYSIKLLSKRDYSIHKLSLKLEAQDFPIDVINSTIDKLLQKKFLREDEYTKSRVKTLIKKGYSSNYIKHQLEIEHLSVCDSLITEVLEYNGLSFESSITDLIDKRLRGKIIPTKEKEREQLKNKTIRFLLSKGHCFSSIDDCISQYF